MKERVLWIDFAKGFAILLMIIGHYQDTPLGLHKWIYTFHMPLFFLFSGYLTAQKTVGNSGKYILRKFKTLLLPYLIFGFLTVVVEHMVKHTDLQKEIVDLLNARTPGIWFLASLFVADLFFMLTRIVKNRVRTIQYNTIQYNTIQITLILLLFSIGLWFNYKNTILPVNMQNIPIILVYLLLGDLFTNPIRQFEKIKSNKLIMIALASFLLSIIVSVPFGNVDLFSNKTNPFSVINALFGIVAVSSGCILLERISYWRILKKVLIYSAINGILILVFHSKIFWFAELLFSKVSFLSSEIIQALIVIILEIVIICPIVYFINKYFYFLLGQSKRIVIKYPI